MASVTIQKRANGRFGVRLNRDDGKASWVGTFDLRREAKAAGDRALSEYRDGRLLAPRRLTLERYWLDTLRPLYLDGNDRLAEGTRLAKHMIFRTYVLPDPIARLPLARVSHDDARRFQARLRQRQTVRGRDLSPGSINNVITQLSWAFNQARRRGYVSLNPCDGVPRLSVEHEPRFLTDAERARLFRSFRLDQDARLAELICETDLRKGEALAVTIEQVDVEPLDVARQLRRDCTLGSLKNRKPRKVGLTTRARQIMREQRAWLRVEWLRQGRGTPLRLTSCGPADVSGRCPGTPGTPH
jgi:hypothetical protein